MSKWVNFIKTFVTDNALDKLSVLIFLPRWDL